MEKRLKIFSSDMRYWEFLWMRKNFEKQKILYKLNVNFNKNLTNQIFWFYPWENSVISKRKLYYWFPRINEINLHIFWKSSSLIDVFFMNFFFQGSAGLNKFVVIHQLVNQRGSLCKIKSSKRVSFLIMFSTPHKFRANMFLKRALRITMWMRWDNFKNPFENSSHMIL